MDVQQAILQRRSTRGFEKTPLTQQEIDTLVQAALAAPSAMNKQPWHFAFVKDAGLLKEFNALAREHMLKNGPAPLRPRFEDPNYELLMGAPLFVILSTDPTGDGPFTGVDCGIAVENLALSAKGMGLGSVIIMEATLSFLGLGVKFPFASWGNIISDVNNTHVLTTYWFIWIPAGVLLLLTVLAFNLVGDGLRDAFDPKMKR